MGDMREAFDALKEHNRQRREARYERNMKAIGELEALGFKVRRITDSQFRVDETLDLYPTNARWHDIRRNKRGGWGRESAAAICARILRPFEARR